MVMATRYRKKRIGDEGELRELLSNQGNTDPGVSSALHTHAVDSPSELESIVSIDVPDLSEPGPPPRYTIDLSRPPRQRYAALARAYRHKLIQLPILFDEILEDAHLQNRFFRPKPIKQLARLALRRVHDPEQMEELVGIQEATGIPMYLLVAFNTLLDMLVGCTSGGVRVVEKGKGGARGAEVRKMLHFRTLDWAMDPLRQIVIDLEFVDRLGGAVVARSITYLGFVGVLTGVRVGLSASFNFRYNLEAWQFMSSWERLRYMCGKTLVLLGRRPSIPSTIRSYLMPGTHAEDDGRYALDDLPGLPSMDQITATFPSMPTAQCFLILSDGDTTTVIEKAWKSAVTRSDSSFIACTNHDQAEEGQRNYRETSKQYAAHQHQVEQNRRDNIPETAAVTGMDEVLLESVDRKLGVEHKWLQAKKRYVQKHVGCDGSEIAVPLSSVKKWMTDERIVSACTHYAVIMNPKNGKVVWAERYPTPDYEDDGDSQ